MPRSNRGGALRVASGFLAVVALAGSAAACGSSSGLGERRSPAPVPPFHSGFADDVAAHMAAAGDRLWVAVAGRPTLRGRDRMTSFRVFARTADAWSQWRRVAVPMGRIDPSEPFFIAPWKTGVCVAAGHDRRPKILCSRDGGAWTTVAAFSRSARIMDLASSMGGGTLAIALVGSRLLTVRIGDDLKATPAARPLPGGPVLARLGDGDGSQPLLAMRRANRGGTLSVYGLRGGAWRTMAKPLDVGIGPQLGGPVADGDDILIPVVQASNGAWPLRVARLSSGHLTLGPPINHGEGSAQGLLEPGSGRPLAIWQQHSAGRGRTFRASIYLKNLDATSAAPRLLWTGFDIGPGDLAVEPFADHLWALTTRARAGHEDKALRVVVGPLG